MGAAGSAIGQGMLSFSRQNNSLTWCPFKGTISESVVVEKGGRFELKGLNEEGTAEWLFINLNKDDLPHTDTSISINISHASPDSTDLKMSNNLSWVRFLDIIKSTKGKGMTTLGKPGWFTHRPNQIKSKTPFGYLMGMKRFSDPEPDDELKGIRGEGRSAVRECLEWMWVAEWDKNLSEQNGIPAETLTRALDERATLRSKQPKFAESSRDQWELVGGPGNSPERWMLIRHPRNNTEE